MNTWWSQVQWYCKCQGTDPWVHVHYEGAPHPCARCNECKEYRPDIPEALAIRILLGPEMLNEDATTILLGPKDGGRIALLWNDIEKAALYDTVLHDMITRIRLGDLSREEGLMAAVLTLARIRHDQHEQLLRFMERYGNPR